LVDVVRGGGRGEGNARSLGEGHFWCGGCEIDGKGACAYVYNAKNRRGGMGGISR